MVSLTLGCLCYLQLPILDNFLESYKQSKDTLDSNSTSTDHDPDRLFKRDRKFEETQDDSEENIWEKYVEIPAFPWKYSAPIKNREGINIL